MMLATVLNGKFKGKNVAVLLMEDKFCHCEFSEGSNLPKTKIAISDLRFWRAYKSVTIKQGKIIKSEPISKNAAVNDNLST